VRWFRLTLALAGLLAAAPAHAWSASGHSAIAALAYRQLDPGTRKKIAVILQQHPAYPSWRPGIAAAGVEADLYLFMRAACWPDEIRSDPKQHRPEWHYINRVYAPDGEGTLPEAEDDILRALTRNKEAFIAEGATGPQKAVALSWLMHLVGDVHQPLHAVSLVNADFPSGDRGGNSFLIQPTEGARNLHSFWDGLFNAYRSPREAARLAGELAASHPRASLKEMGPRNPAEWAYESYRTAVTYAYQHYPDPERPYVVERLKPGTTAENAQPLPKGYAPTARAQASRRAALAGYRLKEALWGLFYGH
jgi:hypothetical protein